MPSEGFSNQSFTCTFQISPVQHYYVTRNHKILVNLAPPTEIIMTKLDYVIIYSYHHPRSWELNRNLLYNMQSSNPHFTYKCLRCKLLSMTQYELHCLFHLLSQSIFWSKEHQKLGWGQFKKHASDFTGKCWAQKLYFWIQPISKLLLM